MSSMYEKLSPWYQKRKREKSSIQASILDLEERVKRLTKTVSNLSKDKLEELASDPGFLRSHDSFVQSLTSVIEPIISSRIQPIKQATVEAVIPTVKRALASKPITFREGLTRQQLEKETVDSADTLMAINTERMSTSRNIETLALPKVILSPKNINMTIDQTRPQTSGFRILHTRNRSMYKSIDRSIDVLSHRLVQDNRLSTAEMTKRLLVINSYSK